MSLYAVQAIPDLLQTEQYTRAVLAMQRPFLPEKTIEQRVQSRAARQEIFSRRDSQLMGFVVEEAVLRRHFGGRIVFREQSEHLLMTGQQHNVEIQVMPTDHEDAGTDGPFTLITREDGKLIAYLEVLGWSTLVTDRE